MTVACFLGGAAGSFLYGAAGPQVQSEPIGALALPPARTPQDMDELLGELRALRADLARIPEARSRVEAERGGEFESSREAELVEQLRALIAGAQAPGGLTRPTEAEAVQRPVVNGVAGLRATVGALSGDSGLLVQQMGAAERRLLDGHLLWTLRDVIEHYGKPAEVQGGESGIFLRYAYGDPSMAFRFTLVDGFVTHVGIEGGY